MEAIMATADLYRLASTSSWVAAVAFVLSGVAIVLFFAGAGSFWGPVNDALIVVTAIALIPVVLAVSRAGGEHGSPWTGIVTVATIAGLVLMATGQSLLIVGRLSLDGSYVTGGIGLLPLLAWIVLVAVLSLSVGVLPSIVGWLAVLSLAAVVAEGVVAAITMGPLLRIVSVGLVAAVTAFFGSLATAFASSAATAANAIRSAA
jgi:hypothetical protein